MQIQVGEIFRVPSQGTSNHSLTHRSYADLTRGRHIKCADINKGIWGYASMTVTATGSVRRPAVILLSNPLKEDSVDTPWVDVIDADRGYALYNGDNHKAGADPLESRGNRLLSELASLYLSDNTRKQAPPLLLFQQVAVGSARKGYRRFMGYGIPKRFFLRTQRDKESDFCFTNLVVELSLFRLERENDFLDWNWIDARRDPKVTDEEALTKAPWAWREWVNSGTPPSIDVHVAFFTGRCCDHVISFVTPIRIDAFCKTLLLTTVKSATHLKLSPRGSRSAC
jgi:hypothetical protein